jgi:hypothetical protein
VSRLRSAQISQEPTWSQVARSPRRAYAWCPSASATERRPRGRRDQRRSRQRGPTGSRERRAVLQGNRRDSRVRIRGLASARTCACRDPLRLVEKQKSIISKCWQRNRVAEALCTKKIGVRKSGTGASPRHPTLALDDKSRPGALIWNMSRPHRCRVLANDRDPWSAIAPALLSPAVPRLPPGCPRRRAPGRADCPRWRRR